MHTARILFHSVSTMIFGLMMAYGVYAGSVAVVNKMVLPSTHSIAYSMVNSCNDIREPVTTLHQFSTLP